LLMYLFWIYLTLKVKKIAQGISKAELLVTVNLIIYY
jgi:hypothetical protein